VISDVQVASDFQAPEMAIDTAMHRLRQGVVAASDFNVDDAPDQVSSSVMDGYHFNFTNCKIALKECGK